MQEITRRIKVGPGPGKRGLKPREGIREPTLNKKKELYGPLLRLLRAIERRTLPMIPSGMPGQVPLTEVLRKVAEKAKEDGVNESEVLMALRGSPLEVLNQDLSKLSSILNSMRQVEIGETLGSKLGSELILSLAIELGKIKGTLVEMSMAEKISGQQVA